MRPFRFGLILTDKESATELGDTATWAEKAGFATVLFTDHLGSPEPFVSAAVAAALTTRVRLGTLVVNNDFHHPAFLAQKTATLDMMSEGRVELGLGAGYVKKEYDEAGVAYDAASVRIERLGEAATILRRLFAGEAVDHSGDHYRLRGHVLHPRPVQGDGLPLLMGGNGDRILALAARQADIINITGFNAHRGTPVITHWSDEGLADRIALVGREAAGREPELGLLIQRVVITDDAAGAAAEYWPSREPEIILRSPFVLLGGIEEIAERLFQLRERHGLSYFTVFETRCDGFEAVIDRLADS